MKDKLQQANKKIEMLGLELAGLKDANDKNNSEKLREIERLKQQIQELNNMIDSLKSNSSDQLKDLQRLLAEKTAKFEQDVKDLMAQQQTELRKMAADHEEELSKLKAQHQEEKTSLLKKA